MSPLPRGAMGRLLEVDLDSRTPRRHPLDERLAKLFVGGRGLGTALLAERFLRLRDRHSSPFRAVDPLAPENPLIITTSPANGTTVPTSAMAWRRWCGPSRSRSTTPTASTTPW